MSKVPWEFHDLVSTDGLRKRPQVSASPLDDPRFWLTPARAESATVADNLHRDALSETLAPMAQLRKIVPRVSEPTFTAPRASAELAKLAGRLGKAWNNAKHRVAVTAMLKPLLTALRFKSSPDNDAARDKVVSSMLDLLGSEVHEAAAG